MTTRLIVFLVAGLLALDTIPASAQRDTAVAVVVNADNPVNNVSRAELRKIFAGEKRTWSNGTAIKLFVRGPGTTERAALLDLLGMSEGDYKKYWTTQVFRGEAQSEPVTLPSNGIQKEAILAFPGGIALVIASDVRPREKVLKVDGHLPEEEGYPVH